MRGSDHLSQVGSLMEAVLRRTPSFSANPLGDWRDLVGDQVARYSQPVSLKKKVLVVVVYDSVWKHHLELNKLALLGKINEKRPEPIVEKIVIRVGELPESLPILNPNRVQLEKARSRRARREKKPKTPLRPLTPEEKELLRSLPDPALRAIGKRLLQRIPSDES
ncbi:MAG: DUF721 domain-containing protein [Syntrophobacteraceae bacterium]|nr:DUF721 domain-containing protein [Syntrophobacteraceae bacterium]